MIKEFFGVVFGLNSPGEVTSGVQLDIGDLNKITKHICLDRLKKPFRNDPGYYTDADEETEILGLEVLDGGKKQIMSIRFKSVLRLNDKYSWLNDECLDLFTDSLNLFQGEFPSSLCFPILASSKLYSLSSVYKIGSTLDVDDKQFSVKLQKFIINGAMSSGLPQLRDDYVHNQKELDEVMGVINISQSHFIVYVANFKERLVTLFDPSSIISNRRFCWN